MRVLTGAQIPTKTFYPETAEIGNMCMIEQIGSGESLPERIAECVQNDLPFFCAEIIRRRDLRRPLEHLYDGRIALAEFTRLAAAAGELYRGRLIVGEYGGMLFWPEGTLGSDGEYQTMPPVSDLTEAAENYYEKLREFSAKERACGGGPFIGICSGMCFPPYQSGVFDSFMLEMMPGSPERMSAAIRGASKAYGMPGFSTLIAHGWYGGSPWDKLYLKRLRNDLNFAYLAGFDQILSECGHFGFDSLGNDIGAHDLPAVEFRRIMREFRDFCNQDSRPDAGPAVPMAFLRGNLDGYSGLWTDCVWGQFNNPAFAVGDPEYGWNLTATIYQKRPWHDNLLRGSEDTSGQPPCGLYDIVPPDAPEKALQRYRLLIVPGWNTMTGDLHQRLLAFVENGGTLLMTLAQLRINTRRDEAPTLFRNGDLRELFGVRIDGVHPVPVTGVKFTVLESGNGRFQWPDWSQDCDPKFSGGKYNAGRIVENHAEILARGSRHFVSAEDSEAERVPVLLEYRHGCGRALLINSWSFPGARALFDFTRTVMEILMRGEQPGNLPVVASDKIRYALYGDTVYVQNTDSDLPEAFQIGGRRYQLAPTEMRHIALKG